MIDRPVMVEIDETADLAYISFSDEPVARTCEVTEAVQLDLDRFNMVVGIEVLQLSAEMPFQRLVTEFHVPFEKVEILRQIRPSVSAFVAHTVGATPAHAPMADAVITA